MTTVDIREVHLTRRPMLAALGAAGLTALAAPAAAATAAAAVPESEPNEKFVFLEYTQATLDAAYDQLHYAPTGLEIVNSYSERSTSVRETRNFSTHSYGTSIDETLDYFTAPSRNSPLCVFIHGGEWRMGTKEMYSFVAPAFLDAGISVAILDFSTISTVGLPGMADQVARAVEWLFQHAKQLGSDPHRTYLAGHSSGAHLAAVTATRNWRGRRVPQNVIKGTVCLGGMYDLYPVLLSYRRGYITLSDQDMDALSPVMHLDAVHAPFLVAYGTNETPEFQRQAVAFAAALREKAPRLLSIRDANHFEVLLRLADASSPLARSAVELMLSNK